MAWGEREQRPHTRHAQTAFATYSEQSRHQMLRQRRDSWMVPQKTSPLFLYICPTKKPSLDRQLDRITAYQGSVLWSKFSDRYLPATRASCILLDSIYRTSTIPLTWFLFLVAYFRVYGYKCDVDIWNVCYVYLVDVAFSLICLLYLFSCLMYMLCYYLQYVQFFCYGFFVLVGLK